MNTKEIGARISSAREMRELTRKELADKIQVAASTITRYERGEIEKIKVPVITSIANALNVNPLWLTGESEYQTVGEMYAHAQAEAFPLSPKEKSLVQTYRALSPAGQKLVDDTLENAYSMEHPRVKKDGAAS